MSNNHHQQNIEVIGDYIIPASPDDFVRSNILINALHGDLTPNSWTLFDYILTRIHTDLDYRKHDKVSTLTFDAKDFFESIKLEGSNSRFTELKKYLTILLKKTLSLNFYDPQTQEQIEDYAAGIILEYEIKRRSSEVTVTLSNKLLPYIFQISTNLAASVAKYSITSQFNSTNTKALYDYFLIRLCAGVYSFSATQDEIREELGLQGKYQRIGDFEKRVLKEPIQDINVFYETDIRVEMKRTMPNNTTYLYHFDLERRTPGDEDKPYEINVIKEDEDDSLIHLLNKPQILSAAEKAIKESSSNISASEYIDHYKKKVPAYDTINNFEATLQIILGMDPDKLLRL